MPFSCLSSQLLLLSWGCHQGCLKVRLLKLQNAACFPVQWSHPTIINLDRADACRLRNGKGGSSQAGTGGMDHCHSREGPKPSHCWRVV